MIRMLFLLYAVLAIFLILSNVTLTSQAWIDMESGSDRDYLRTLNVFLWILLPLTGVYSLYIIFIRK